MFLWRLLKRLVKALNYLVIIIVLIPTIGIAYGFLSTPSVDTTPLLYRPQARH